MTDDPSTPPGSSASLGADRLGELLRAAMPPTRDQASRRDVWPEVLDRLERGPRWTMLDLGLAAAAAIALLMFPDWLWLLVYHL
jgi:hypothetical protein